MKEANIKFICPKCGHTKLVERQTVSLWSEISKVTVFGSGIFDLGYLPITDKNVDWDTSDLIENECAMCGYLLPRDSESLVKWLEEHEMIDYGRAGKP
jgi:hypothetical protein